LRLPEDSSIGAGVVVGGKVIPAAKARHIADAAGS